MSEFDEPPFTPDPRDVSRLGNRLARLGLTPEACHIIGSTALHLQGLIEFPGRTDLIVDEQGFTTASDRLFRDEELVVHVEPAPDNTTNDMLIYYPRHYGAADQVHVISHWTSEHDIEEVTFESMAALVWPPHGFNTIEPITSIKWLLTRGYKTDQTVAYRALRSLRGLRVPDLDALSARADQVWPRTPRPH